MRLSGVVVLGADDPDLLARAEAATYHWEVIVNSAGHGTPAEQGAFEESQRLASELDAAADERAVEGVLTDEHRSVSAGVPVVLISGAPMLPGDLPPGSVVEVEPSGDRLRRRTRGGAVAVTEDEMVQAVAEGRATIGEYSRFTDEEHHLVTEARRAGYNVIEGAVHRPPGTS